jgi:hypothetical protein
VSEGHPDPLYDSRSASKGASVLVASNFWDVFFLLLIWIPLITLWIFALADVFRRDDLRGIAKAAWVACIIFLPYFGSFLYLMARSGSTAREEYPSDRPRTLA